MFEYITPENPKPSFPDAVILINSSDHIRIIDSEGRRLPSHSTAAISIDEFQNSTIIADLIASGRLVALNAPNKSAEPAKRGEVDDQPEQKKKIRTKQSDIETIPELVKSDQISEIGSLVAEPKHEDWVSSTNDIVNEKTTDEI
jgi:hypothetical protein